MNNDLISRSELKKAYFNAINETSIGEVSIIALIDNAPTVELDGYVLYGTGLELVSTDWLEEQLGKERPRGEWILVSAGLPERYKEVIVTDIEVSNTYQSRYIGNGYWECDNGTFKNRIIAWQPLPEPYKEGGAE